MRDYVRGIVLALVLVGAYLAGTQLPTADAQGQPRTAMSFGKSRTFTTQTTTGATASFIMGEVVVAHTAELIVTGGPAACTYRLQGSRDGTTWFNISAADITCTTTTAAFVAAAPAQYTRGNLLTLSGGTTPTVTLKYVGK